MNFLTAFLCFEVGLLVGGYAVDFFFLEPLRKRYLKQNEDIHKFLDAQIINLQGILEKMPDKEKDGSMVSPIQIKREN